MWQKCRMQFPFPSMWTAMVALRRQTVMIKPSVNTSYGDFTLKHLKFSLVHILSYNIEGETTVYEMSVFFFSCSVGLSILRRCRNNHWYVSLSKGYYNIDIWTRCFMQDWEGALLSLNPMSRCFYFFWLRLYVRYFSHHPTQQSLKRKLCDYCCDPYL